MKSTWVLRCPNDTNRIAAVSFSKLSRTNLSYFVGLDAQDSNPATLLTGDRNIQGGNPMNGVYTLLTHSNLAGWDSNLHHFSGNIGLADGSVQQMNKTNLNKQLQILTNEVVRLVIP